MKLNKLLVFAMFINMLTTACDSCDTVNSNADNNKTTPSNQTVEQNQPDRPKKLKKKKNLDTNLEVNQPDSPKKLKENKNLDTSNIKPEINNIEYLPDNERQKDIKKEYKDNFNFDQFNNVKWDDPTTFGEFGKYAIIDPKDNTMPTELNVYNDFGVTKENYEVMTIAPDGSCFMRSAFNASLYRTFNNQTMFDDMIKNISIQAKKYENVPGFTQRFRAKDLITLLQTLNKLPAEERTEALNKDKVNSFLNYSFRALFSARNIDTKKDLLNINEWGSIRSNTFDFQEMLLPDHNLAVLFPQEGLKDQFFIKIPGENKKLEFNKDYKKDFIELYDKNIDSKKLEEDVKKANEELIQAPNEKKKEIADKYEEIFKLNKKIKTIKDIELFKARGIKDLKDFYQLEEMSILPYRIAGGNHAQVLVRKNINKPKPSKTTYLPDNERQKDIKEDYLKDNFNFDQFNNVKWDDPTTFGESGKYAYSNGEPTDITSDKELPLLGITKDKYKKITIRGDGSCFMRASFHAILFRAFENDDTFEEFITNIKNMDIKYKDSPGFSNRFRADDLITLFKTLKVMTPKERLANLNKKYTDTFLDYSFRSLNVAATKNDNKIIIKYLLTNHAYENHASAMDILSYLLPKLDIMYHYASDIDTEYKIYSKNKANNFNLTLDKILSEKIFNDPELANDQRVINLKNRNNIVNSTDFGKIKATAVMPFRTINDNHVDLMVRKDALKDFGLE